MPRIGTSGQDDVRKVEPPGTSGVVLPQMREGLQHHAVGGVPIDAEVSNSLALLDPDWILLRLSCDFNDFEGTWKRLNEYIRMASAGSDEQCRRVYQVLKAFESAYHGQWDDPNYARVRELRHGLRLYYRWFLANSLSPLHTPGMAQIEERIRAMSDTEFRILWRAYRTRKPTGQRVVQQFFEILHEVYNARFGSGSDSDK
jgi:hypothetical protein